MIQKKERGKPFYHLKSHTIVEHWIINSPLSLIYHRQNKYINAKRIIFIWTFYCFLKTYLDILRLIQTSFGHLKESKSETEAKGSRGGSCKETHGKY